MCGCKGCQEITTVDLANNTETITQLPTEECGSINSTVKVLSCECGITLDIYNDSGILVESNESGMYDGGEGGFFYEFTNSTIWTSQLGSNYILRITYNYLLNRWELSYYNEDLEETVIIGIYYSDSACPTSIIGWDLDCISFIFQPRLTQYVITWNGEYLNGRKKYSAFIDDTTGGGGAFTWTFFWSAINNRWEIERDPGTALNWAYNDLNINCVPTEVTWYNTSNDSPTLYQTYSIGVNNYNVKVSPIECQCCDEKLTLTITLTGKPPEEIEIIAEVVTEESLDNCDCIHVSFTYEGVDYEFNVPKTGLANGKNKYNLEDLTIGDLTDSYISIAWGGGLGSVWNFTINGSDIIYLNNTNTECPVFNNWTYVDGIEIENLVTTSCDCDCIKVTYQLKGEEPVTVEVQSIGILNGKKYYNLIIDDKNVIIKWDSDDNLWYVQSLYIYDDLYLDSQTECPFGTFIIPESPSGLIFESFVVSECSNASNSTNPLIYNGYPYYSFNIEGDIYYIIFSTITNSWVVSTTPNEESTIILLNSSSSLCPYGYYNTDAQNFLRFWVRGYDCGDQVEKDFCEKLHNKQCEFATKTLKYLKHLQFGNTCCDELDALKNDKRVLEILNCYDTRDIPANTTEYNTIPYVQIKRLLGC